MRQKCLSTCSECLFVHCSRVIETLFVCRQKLPSSEKRNITAQDTSHAIMAPLLVESVLHFASQVQYMHILRIHQMTTSANSQYMHILSKWFCSVNVYISYCTVQFTLQLVFITVHICGIFMDLFTILGKWMVTRSNGQQTNKQGTKLSG